MSTYDDQITKAIESAQNAIKTLKQAKGKEYSAELKGLLKSAYDDLIQASATLTSIRGGK